MIYSAVEITYLLKGTVIPILENEVSGFEFWAIFKSFLDLLVGKSSSISISDIDNICREEIGDSWNLGMINDNLINQIQDQIINDLQIPEPEIPFIIDAIVPGCVGSPKTFVFFGERLTLDSYAFQHLVHPYVNQRTLPVGLDFAATCLESQRALELLADGFEENGEYRNAILNLIDEINNAPQEKKQTIQWQWIESLKHIAVNTPECDGSITIPEFMLSSNWLDEKVTSIMGSYAQLRHDTILYQKQSTTYMICSCPTGYVEPYPEFYQSLGELSQYFKSSLTLLEEIGYNFSNRNYSYLRALDNFYYANLMLTNISIKELTENQLTYEEKLFIVETYGEFGANICGGPFIYGWLPGILKWIDDSYYKPDINPNTRASLVADIHTDPNYGEVLHLATGILEPIIAVVPSWNGTLIPVVGPVFSYYEFNLSNYYRLNDNEWRGIIAAWLDINERENHNFDLFQRGFWANNYMVNTEMTLSRIYEDDQTYNPPGWF